MPIVAAGDATLSVREWGEPTGMPFLFWHSVGAGGSGATIDVAAGPLAQAGFRVLAPDAPGFGRSPSIPPAGYALDRLAELLWHAADALGADRAVVSGHSWGGVVAVIAAALRPERTTALVLYDSGHCDYANWPGADLDQTYDEVLAAMQEDAAITSWEALLTELRENSLDQEWTLAAWREAVEELPGGDIRMRVDAASRAAAFHEMIHAYPSRSWPAIAAARIPTLLVLATEPPEVRDANERLVAGFLEAMPHADVVRPPSCRHQVFADLGAESGTLVAEWLHAQGLA